MSTINATLGNIAAAIEEIYNNGRVVTSDEKLQYEDFLQMSLLAFGDIASIQYYKELRAGNQAGYFSQSIQRIVCDIKKSENGIPPFIKLDAYSLLPYSGGIIAVYPVTEESVRDPENDYTKMPPGSESLYGKPKILDDLGLRFFVCKGENLELFGGDNCGKVYVEYLPIGEESTVTLEIGWIIIKEVLKVVMPEKVLPADTHEDNDPNIATYKQRLDQPQSI